LEGMPKAAALGKTVWQLLEMLAKELPKG
jgi:hypothetical protein